MSPRRQAGLTRFAYLITAAVIVITAGAFWLSARNGPVVNPDVEFKAPPPRARVRVPAERFVWPMYGYDRARRRAIATELRPPFSRVWRFNANQLLEFSPILAHGRLFVVRKDARVYAIDVRTGRRIWSRKAGALNASSPAYSNGRIFVATLSGRIVALDARTGRIRWRREVGSRTESSPLVIGGSVVFGTEGGTLFRLRQRDGKIEWTYKAGGKLKAAPAFASGKIFIGAYGGSMHAVSAATGRRLWSSGTSGARFGLASGNFYATPAVAYGRVFAGNTDGRVYAFAASSGRLAWSRPTGAFVYSAAAVDDVPRLGPTVFVGSHDGNFYALNARDGAVRWSFRSGGRISGAPTVVGGIVYFADLGRNAIYGLTARKGRRVFYRSSGAYNPVIADGRRLYMTGYESIAALVPRARAREERRAVRRALRARRDGAPGA